MNTLYILCGLPGAMKSHTAKRIMRSSRACADGALIVSGDSLRTMIRGEYSYDSFDEPVLLELAMSSIYTISKTRRDIIYDEVNLTKSDRKQFIDIAREIGYKPVVVYCKSDGKHLERRMADPKGYDPEHWRKIIYHMESIFVPPDMSEGCEVVTEHAQVIVPRFGKDFM